MVHSGYEEEEPWVAQRQWFSRFPTDTASQQASSSETFPPENFSPPEFRLSLAASVHLSRRSKSLYMLINISLFSSV